MKKTLSVGVLLDATTVVPSWQRLLLERLRALSCCRLSTAVHLVGDADVPDLIGGPRDTSHALYRAYARLDRALFPTDPDIFDRVPLEPEVAGLERETIRLENRGGVRWVANEEDVRRVRRRGLDVVLYLGDGELDGSLLGIANVGVWAMHHGDYETQRGGPPGFWEVVESRPATGITLRMLAPDPGQWRVLGCAWSATHDFSPNRNRNQYYWRWISLVCRTLEELCRDGERRFFQRLGQKFPRVDFYSDRDYRHPTNLAAIGVIARIARRTAAVAWQKATTRHNWYLVFAFADRIGGDLHRFRELQAPRGRFWADPFAIERDGRYHVFFEELDHSTGKGHISVLEVNEEGESTPPRIVLERPYHLSYPFLLEWEGRLFMVPESSANQTVELYECVEFPHRWEFRRNLFQGVSTVDSTFLYHEGRWWMFSSKIEPQAHSYNDELHLYWTEDLLEGEWHPHPLNPVIADVRRARPAGAIFRHGNRLYRPSQDCSGIYGRRLNISEIVVLTEHEYIERPVTTVCPGWRPGVLGVHTLNRAGRLTVMDAFSRRSRLG